MSGTPAKRKRLSKPKRQKVKQGHKLVWLTLVIILVPVLVIGYVLLTSAKESDQPVEGNRFGPNDLNPKIQDTQLDSIQNELMQIGGMETATIDLKSATLRVHLNMVDSADQNTLEAAAHQAYNIINEYLPIETYFTNSAEGKNYDLEIDSYNYIVDDNHPVDNWRFVKVSKSGAGDQVTDIITQPRNADLAEAVKNQDIQTPGTSDPAAAQAEGEAEDTTGDEYVDQEYVEGYYQ